MSEICLVYLGLGSNLAEPKQQLQQARQTLANCEHHREIAFSSLYTSPPLGPRNQPDYVNAVMAIETCLSPFALLENLQAIENQHGRLRQQRWGARTLDLDILLYGQQIIQQPNLTIPHLGLSQRAFVLYPLAEIAADLSIPNQGRLSDLLLRCDLQGLKKCL
jgi:2-amino-4-hydroxy-6-hydroxymethyldihydropteridine diphosphokinase